MEAPRTSKAGINIISRAEFYGEIPKNWIVLKKKFKMHLLASSLNKEKLINNNVNRIKCLKILLVCLKACFYLSKCAVKYSNHIIAMIHHMMSGNYPIKKSNGPNYISTF